MTLSKNTMNLSRPKWVHFRTATLLTVYQFSGTKLLFAFFVKVYCYVVEFFLVVYVFLVEFFFSGLNVVSLSTKKIAIRS